MGQVAETSQRAHQPPLAALEGATLVRSRRRSGATGAVLAVLLSGSALAACTGSTVDSAGARPADAVTVLTGFNVTGQDAWLYVGQQRGFFREAGLEVAVRPGKGTGDNLAVLGGGQATFAVVDMTGAVQQRDAGRTDFRVVAAVYQRSVSCIVAFEGSGITSPRDLEGKKVGYSTGGVNYTLFPAYARLAGIDATKVVWQQSAPPTLRPLLAAGRLDAITEIVIGQKAIEAATGRKLAVLRYSDYLGDLYGNVVAASTATVNNRPELVRRFTTAMLRALDYTISHPDEAGTLLHQAQPQYPAAAAADEVRATEGYVRSGVGIGTIDEGRVMQSITLLQGAGLVKPGLRPADVLALSLLPGASPPPGS